MKRLAAGFLGVAFGIALVAALRSGLEREREQSPELQGLIAREAELSGESAYLMRNLTEAEGRLHAVEAEAASQNEDMAVTRLALERARVLSGQTDMQGPGIRLVLDDAPREAILPGEDIRWYIVHDVDVLRVVNHLRGAGAECISINGERLVSNSRIRCGGPTIHVKDRTLAPPFEILAIGDPDVLLSSLTQPLEQGGMSEMEVLQFFGVRAEVSVRQSITVPRYSGVFKFAHAGAIAGEENG